MVLYDQKRSTDVRRIPENLRVVSYYATVLSSGMFTGEALEKGLESRPVILPARNPLVLNLELVDPERYVDIRRIFEWFGQSFVFENNTTYPHHCQTLSHRV